MKSASCLSSGTMWHTIPPSSPAYDKSETMRRAFIRRPFPRSVELRLSNPDHAGIRIGTAGDSRCGSLVLERNPRAAVRHHIGSGGCCYVERGTHALPDRFVPRPSLLLDVDAGGLPEVEFGDMGARTVAARDKGCALGLDGLQRKGGVP